MGDQIKVCLYYCPFCAFRGESRMQYMLHLSSHDHHDNHEAVMDTMKQGSTLKPVERMKPHFPDSTSDPTTYVSLSLDMHDYALPRNTNVPSSLISHISEAALHLYSTEELLLEKLTTKHNKAILDTFLQLKGFMPYKELYGIFFMFSVSVKGQLFYHFLEGGQAFGFLHNSQSIPPPAAYYRQHTQEELNHVKELKDFQYHRKIHLIDERMKILSGLDRTVVPAMFIYIRKNKTSRKLQKEYHFQFGLEVEEDSIKKELNEYMDNGCKSYPKTYPPTEQLSLHQQYNVLSNLPNDHTAPLITSRLVICREKDRKKRTETCRAYQACRRLKKGGEIVGGRAPPYSFRNRLIYYLKHYKASSISTMLRYHYDGVVPAVPLNACSLPEDSVVRDILPDVTCGVDGAVSLVPQHQGFNHENFLWTNEKQLESTNSKHGTADKKFPNLATEASDIGSDIGPDIGCDIGSDMGCFRQHCPLTEDHPQLLRLRRERLATAAAHAPVEPTPPNRTEFVEGEDLIPEIPDLCECASSVEYKKEYEFLTTIYYLMYPAKHRVFKLVCMNRRCEILYNGEKDCVHFYTREFGCATETGYECVSHMLKNGGDKHAR